MKDVCLEGGWIIVESLLVMGWFWFWMFIGSFLVFYFIMFIVEGMSFLYLELAVG